MDDYIDAMKEDVEKALEALDTHLQTIRTGRATPQLVDGVSVHVASYGATMPLNQLATVQAPDARLLTVTPWDKSTLADVERAIISADLGLNPSNDGILIRVPVPALTADRRQELVRQVKKFSEDIRIRVRHLRREYNDIFKGAEDDGDISEDDLHRLLARVQVQTDSAIKRVEAASDAKEAEVLEV